MRQGTEMEPRAGCRVSDAAIALGVTGLAFAFLVVSSIAGQDAPSPVTATEGTLVAAFVTKGEIVLCSDGRVVNSADGVVVRDDWSKVHRLNDRVGMLTAGRELPGARFSHSRQARADRIHGDRRDRVGAADGARRGVEQRRGRHRAGRMGQAGRSCSWRDSTSAARPGSFTWTARSRPAFRVTEMPLFTDVRDLEIGAIATGTEQEDPSTTIVKHLGGLQARQPTIGLHRIAARRVQRDKAELGARNYRIGGLTFAAAIDRQTGFRAITAVVTTSFPERASP